MTQVELTYAVVDSAVVVAVVFVVDSVQWRYSKQNPLSNTSSLNFLTPKTLT